MPKTRKRKKTTGQKAIDRVSAGSVAVQEQPAHEHPARAVRQPSTSSAQGGGVSIQKLAYPAMVALGFWGLTLFCFFFLADPNHSLYGVIMGLTAVGWSFIVIRRWQTYRQRV